MQKTMSAVLKKKIILESGTPAVPIPSARFTADTLSGDFPLTVQFTDTSTNTPTSWAWTFGDAGTSTAQNPSHEYAAAGSYTVGLTATNAGGSDLETKVAYVAATSASYEWYEAGGVISPSNLIEQFTNMTTATAYTEANLKLSTEPITYVFRGKRTSSSAHGQYISSHYNSAIKNHTIIWDAAFRPKSNQQPVSFQITVPLDNYFVLIYRSDGSSTHTTRLVTTGGDDTQNLSFSIGYGLAGPVYGYYLASYLDGSGTPLADGLTHVAVYDIALSASQQTAIISEIL